MLDSTCQSTTRSVLLRRVCIIDMLVIECILCDGDCYLTVADSQDHSRDTQWREVSQVPVFYILTVADSQDHSRDTQWREVSQVPVFYILTAL
jgi:hypothetical protein